MASREEELEELYRRYARAADLGERAGLLEQLVIGYSGQVRSIARRFSGSGVALEDMVQAGFMGLMSAVDADEVETFTPYAAGAIANAIRSLLKGEGLVRVPQAIQAQRAQVREASSRMGRYPTAVEIATELDIEEDRVREIISAFPSLSMLVDSNVRERRDVAPPPLEEMGGEDPGLDLSQHEQRAILERALRHLNDRQRSLIEHRFWKGLSKAETARQLGINKSTEQDWERKALQILREHAVSLEPPAHRPGLEEVIADRAGQQGLPVGEARVLVELHRGGGDLSGQELIRRMRLSSVSYLWELLSRMERRGWISRDRNKRSGDGREVLLRLTSDGRAAADDLIAPPGEGASRPDADADLHMPEVTEPTAAIPEAVGTVEDQPGTRPTSTLDREALLAEWGRWTVLAPTANAVRDTLAQARQLERTAAPENPVEQTRLRESRCVLTYAAAVADRLRELRETPELQQEPLPQAERVVRLTTELELSVTRYLDALEEESTRGSALYALSPDGGNVIWCSESGPVTIGGPGVRLHGGSSGLFLEKESGEIERWLGRPMAWERLGDRGRLGAALKGIEYAVNDRGIYALADGRVFEWNEDEGWLEIGEGRGYTALQAAGSRVWASKGRSYSRWSEVGWHFHGEHLGRLISDGSSVYSLGSDGRISCLDRHGHWSALPSGRHGPFRARQVVASPFGLLAVEQGSGELHVHMPLVGGRGSWIATGSRPRRMVVAPGGVYLIDEEGKVRPWLERGPHVPGAMTAPGRLGAREIVVSSVPRPPPGMEEPTPLQPPPRDPGPRGRPDMVPEGRATAVGFSTLDPSAEGGVVGVQSGSLRRVEGREVDPEIFDLLPDARPVCFLPHDGGLELVSDEGEVYEQLLIGLSGAEDLMAHVHAGDDQGRSALPLSRSRLTLSLLRINDLDNARRVQRQEAHELREDAIPDGLEL